MKKIYSDFEKRIKWRVKSQIGSTEHIIKSITDYTKYLIGLDVESMESQVLIDESYQQIQNISCNVESIALKKLHNEPYDAEEINSDEIKHKLDSLMNGVNKYNVEKAKWAISEAICDICYINGGRAMSLRLGQIYMRMMNEKQQNE